MKTFKKLVCLMAFISLFMACSSNDDENLSNCDECDYTVASGETSGTVPAALHGTHNLTLQFSQNGYTKTDGTTGVFTISATELKIEIDGDECIILRNPIASANQLEFTFKDTCRDDLIYSVSVSNTGGLNEVNVGDLNATFFGQFH